MTRSVIVGGIFFYSYPILHELSTTTNWNIAFHLLSNKSVLPGNVTYLRFAQPSRNTGDNIHGSQLHCNQPAKFNRYIFFLTKFVPSFKATYFVVYIWPSWPGTMGSLKSRASFQVQLTKNPWCVIGRNQGWRPGFSNRKRMLIPGICRQHKCRKYFLVT